MKPIPAVVTPLDEHMGLDIARSLGRQGIPVYGLDPDPHAAGGKSRYCQLVTCPDPKKSEADYLQFLADWGKQLGSKAVLYALSDDVALLCSRERGALQAYYEYVMPDHASMVKLASKAGLALAAQECGIPAPQTFMPRDAQELERAAAQLSFPAILKPVEGVYWHTPTLAARPTPSARSACAT